MKNYHSYLLNELSCDRESISELLTTDSEELRSALFCKAESVRNSNTGNRVFLRGLIELSNQCSRDCHYCGIRAGNHKTRRYEMDHQEVMDCVSFAWDNRLRSVVIQSGERSDREFIRKIGQILNDIKKQYAGDMVVTLSCGEQSEETFKYWRECGASRYLLRIETSNTGLYERLHPADGKHSFRNRLKALETLKKLDYQTGSGVMIGVPGQTMEMLAMDLAFLRNFNVDMVGMGPYIEHQDAKLPPDPEINLSLHQRLELSLRMIALLRLLMPDINIAASTALQAIDADARLQAIRCGANVVMPNITPLKYREDYLLYDNKPGVKIDGAANLEYWNRILSSTACVPAWDEAGDPKHYKMKKILI